MPFGKWTDFDACVVDMMGPPNKYSKEVAEKTCGKIQHRLEGKEVFKILKSSSGRRVIEQYVTVEEMDEDSDIIPLHRFKEGLEEIRNWDPRYHGVHWRHSSYDIGHILWSFTDEDGVTHETEVDEYGLWGLTEIRNDGYKKADEIWGRIMRGEKMGASIGVVPSSSPLILSKDVLEERGFPDKWKDAKYWDVPIQFIEAWSLTEKPANRYVTAATILSKEYCDPCIEARAKWYLENNLEKDEEKAWARATKFFERVAEAEEELEGQEALENLPDKIDAEKILRKHGFGKK